MSIVLAEAFTNDGRGVEESKGDGSKLFFMSEGNRGS